MHNGRQNSTTTPYWKYSSSRFLLNTQKEPNKLTQLEQRKAGQLSWLRCLTTKLVLSANELLDRWFQRVCKNYSARQPETFLNSLFKFQNELQHKTNWANSDYFQFRLEIIWQLFQLNVKLHMEGSGPFYTCVSISPVPIIHIYPFILLYFSYTWATVLRLHPR